MNTQRFPSTRSMRSASPQPVAPCAAGDGQPVTPLKPAPVREVVTESDEEIHYAPMFRVLIHNDEKTPMDFVVIILTSVFRKKLDDAMEIMMTAHHGGVALVSVLPLEEAEFRMDRAHALARTQKFPLTFTREPVEG